MDTTDPFENLPGYAEAEPVPADFLDRAAQNLRWRVDSIESRKERLYTPEGKPRLSDELHQQKLDALHAELAEEVHEAQRAALGAGKTAAREAALLHAEPTSWLPAADVVAAHMRADFVQEQVERATLGELIAQARAALAEPDSVTLWLLARYIGQRLDDERDRAQRGNGRVPEQFGELAEVHRALQDAAFPERIKQRVAAAGELRERALNLYIDAARALREATGAETRRREQFADFVRRM